MDEKILFFFTQKPGALPLYHAFVCRLLAELPDTEIRVQKTQISFYNRRMFACVSFAHIRRKAQRPEPYLVVTFGLDHKVESPRIDVATEPSPHRWTHHVLISEPEEIDDELMGWIKAASLFSAGKR